MEAGVSLVAAGVVASVGVAMLALADGGVAPDAAVGEGLGASPLEQATSRTSAASTSTRRRAVEVMTLPVGGRRIGC